MNRKAGKTSKNMKNSKNSRNRFAVVIPVYNHAATVVQVVRQVQNLGYPVFVVDDGCLLYTSEAETVYRP